MQTPIPAPTRGVIWRADAPPADPPARAAGVHECVIAIPARDEAELIGACLRALAEQQEAPDFAAALVLNNCSDDTAGAVRAMADEIPFPLHVFDVALAPEHSNAAWARRLAVNAAASLVCEGGVILSTDADSRADARWVRNVLDCFDAGADVVCGFVAPDFSDAPPLSFDAIRRGALEFEYSQLTAEIISLLNPEAHDPWPNHLIETGANLALRAHIVSELGGVPHVCPGEDQLMVAMARRAGYRIRHAFPPSVTTSSRVRGRAEGGWSDDLMSRLADDRATCHPKLEPARMTLRRARLCARLRQRYGEADFARHVERLTGDETAVARIMDAAHFPAAWALIEEHAPSLKRQPLYAAELDDSAALLRTHVRLRTVKPAAKAAQALDVK